MAFLHLIFDNFEFRDLGHSDFLSFKVLAPTQKYACSVAKKHEYLQSSLLTIADDISFESNFRANVSARTTLT